MLRRLVLAILLAIMTASAVGPAFAHDLSCPQRQEQDSEVPADCTPDATELQSDEYVAAQASGLPSPSVLTSAFIWFKQEPDPIRIPALLHRPPEA